MSWDAIGALGEVLDSIAVFVTLGYLAVQLRHARSETCSWRIGSHAGIGV